MGETWGEKVGGQEGGNIRKATIVLNVKRMEDQ